MPCRACRAVTGARTKETKLAKDGLGVGSDHAKNGCAGGHKKDSAEESKGGERSARNSACDRPGAEKERKERSRAMLPPNAVFAHARDGAETGGGARAHIASYYIGDNHFRLPLAEVRRVRTGSKR